MLKIKRFRSSDELLWDKFVPTTNNGTLFHLRRFLNYHADDRFKDHSLCVTKKNSLFSVFPAAEKILKGDRILFSHPGASMGSFAVPENLSIADAISLANALVQYAAKEKFDGINNRTNLNKHRQVDYFPKLNKCIHYSIIRVPRVL